MELCAHWPREACLGVCNSEVESTGRLGDLVASACASCLEGATCDKLASGWGPCQSSCPYPVPDNPLSADAGRADTGTNQSSGCSERWTPSVPGGTTYEMACDRSSNDYYCECYRSGVRTGGFYSNDVCRVSRDERTARAETGCHWRLADTTHGCLESYLEGEFTLLCEWDDRDTYQCACGNGSRQIDTFGEPDDFCASPAESRRTFATSQCHWECLQEWSHQGAKHEVVCDDYRAVDCLCYIDGVLQPVSEHGFGRGFCLGDLATRTSTANAACHWTLP